MSLLFAVTMAAVGVLPMQVNLVGGVDHKGRVVEPVVIHVQKFTQDSAKSFAEKMREAHLTGQSVIPVVVDSYGGSVYALMSMVDIIRASKIPVATIVTGKAMSAGAVFLSCGTPGYRYAAPSATIMIHEVSAMVAGKNQEIKMTAAEVDRLNTLLFHTLAHNAGKKSNYFLNAIHAVGHADWYLTAKEGLLHGVVDHVGVPTFEITYEVKTKLVK